MRKRKILLGIGGAFLFYALRFPFRLFEDWVMGLMQGEIVENWQNVLSFSTTWVLPFIVIIGAMYLGYWYRKPKSSVEASHGMMETQSNYAVKWVRGEWNLLIPNGSKPFWDDENDGRGLLLIGFISVTTIGTIQVESVSLDIGDQRYTSDWESEGFYTSEEREVQFEFPLNTARGKRTAMLKAIVDGEPYTSKPFMLDLPRGKQVFRRGGSQN
ncbi:MAG: hypothetical protein ACXABY_26640 [Candidatus Thorarchaeota archaeon]|jgi:hypothetical protein